MFTEIDQQTLDIDWFFTNSEYVAFVASGGGKLPNSVARSRDNNRLLASFFNGLPDISEIIIDPDLSNVIGKRANERYLADFVKTAKKGLFAFDKTVLNNFSDLTYHLVAKPLVLLKVGTLPIEIINLLFETKYDGEIGSILNTTFIR